MVYTQFVSLLWDALSHHKNIRPQLRVEVCYPTDYTRITPLTAGMVERLLNLSGLVAIDHDVLIQNKGVVVFAYRLEDWLAVEMFDRQYFLVRIPVEAIDRLYGPKGTGKQFERYHPRLRLLPVGEELPAIVRPAPTPVYHPDCEPKSRLMREMAEADGRVVIIHNADVSPCLHCAGGGDEDCPHCDGDGFVLQ